MYVSLIILPHRRVIQLIQAATVIDPWSKVRLITSPRMVTSPRNKAFFAIVGWIFCAVELHDSCVWALALQNVGISWPIRETTHLCVDLSWKMNLHRLSHMLTGNLCQQKLTKTWLNYPPVRWSRTVLEWSLRDKFALLGQCFCVDPNLFLHRLIICKFRSSSSPNPARQFVHNWYNIIGVYNALV